MPAAEQPQQSNVVPMQSPSQQTASSAELNDIIAKQAALIQSQGTAIRDLETQLGLQPGGTPLVPGAAANLNNLIGMHTAAIRTQAAYMQHLNDIQLNDGV